MIFCLTVLNVSFCKIKRTNSLIQIKDVINRFEVSRATLHNWKKSKPKLYAYLLNYKKESDKANNLRDVNIVLEKYAKESIKPLFSYEEIFYMHAREFDLQDAQNMQKLFVKSCIKEMNEDFEFIINIYNKIKSLNIVERYILSLRLKKLKESKEHVTKEYIIHHFREFLKI